MWSKIGALLLVSLTFIQMLFSLYWLVMAIDYYSGGTYASFNTQATVYSLIILGPAAFFSFFFQRKYLYYFRQFTR